MASISPQSATGKQIDILKGDQGAIKALAISHDGKTLATGGVDRTVKLWDINTGQKLATLRGLPNWVHGLQFRNDDRAMAAWCVGNTVTLWNADFAKAK